MLIEAHATQPLFLDCMLRLLKILIKDLLTFERSLKEKKPLPKIKKGNNQNIQEGLRPSAEMETSLLNIKRSILYKVAKFITEFEGDQFKRNLIDILIKNNQSFKFENNNNNHPTIKNILKLLGVGTITQIDDKESNLGGNKHKKLLKPLGNELVPIKDEKKPDDIKIN